MRKTREGGRIYWSYEDLGIFFVLVTLLTLALHALVRFGQLKQGVQKPRRGKKNSK